MALVTPSFFDTSVLVAGLIEIGPASEHAQKIMSRIADGKIRAAATAWHCCLEFFAVSTRLPEEFRLAPPDAIQLIEEEILARFRVEDLPEKARRIFLRTVRADRLIGGRIYDGHIGEIAREMGAKLVITENRRHFLGLLRHGIRVLSAEEFASRAQ